jgi:cytochrome P450
LYTRGEWYDALRFDPERDNLVTCPTKKHAELRAKMAGGYSGKEVEGVEAKIDKNLLALVELIEERYVAKNRPFDFGRKAQYFTLDVISDLAYGDPFGFLKEDGDRYSYIRITEEQFSMLLTFTIYPWIVYTLSSRYLKFLLPNEKDLVGFGKLMG